LHKKDVHVSSLESIEETINKVVQLFLTEENDDSIAIIDDLSEWMRSELVDYDE